MPEARILLMTVRDFWERLIEGVTQKLNTELEQYKKDAVEEYPRGSLKIDKLIGETFAHFSYKL